MSDETTLLSCPMCGSTFVQVRWIGFTHTHNGAFSAGYRGECCDCGLTTRAFNDKAEAIIAWNTRVTTVGSAEVRNAEKMRGGWNGCKELVAKRADPVEMLLVRVLDGWMEDYVRELRSGERYAELDVIDDMAHDVCVYRRELMKLLEVES